MRSILLVDDEPALLEIASLFLERKSNIKVITALSGQEAIEIINTHQTLEGIVSDYDMPEMNGLQLLDFVRQTEKDLAFILFTGRGREEVAIQALNNGADFYLQKGGDPKSQFTELANMVERAIRSRESITLLKHNEMMFRDFFEHSSDAIFILKDGVFFRCNQEFTNLTGYVLEEIIGRAPFELSPDFMKGGQPDFFMAKNTLVTSGHDAHSYLWKYVTKDGAVRNLDVRLLSFSFQNEILIHGVIRDVTRELEREHLQQLTQLRLETLLTLHSKRDVSAKEITDYALEKAVQITDSQYGYLAFVHKDETELEMYSWSHTAMQDCQVYEKPIIYQVAKTGLWGEPIRQRKPIITNNYAQENLLRKGIPKGHIPLQRHMGVPIFHGESIVMVAGVANKITPYNPDDADQLILLLNGLWDLLEKKKVEDELFRKNEELAVAYEELLTADEELRKMIALKDESD